jgi:hypothetical protein
MPRFQQITVAITLALTASLALTSSGEAKPMKFGQRVSDCKTWDCSGGIICSCCFFNGCWICDAKWDGTPDNECHWDDAAGNQGITPGTKIPEGGLLDPGAGGTVTPKLQQLPTTGGATR